MSALLWAGLALAADWHAIQGTEIGQPDQAVRPWGFAEMVAEGILARPVEGLQSEALAPFEGELASFNHVAAGEASWSFNVRRARMGLRGSVPGTAQRVAWMAAIEGGNNGLTRDSRVVLSDASATLSFVPGLRLRVGQFKLPLMDETLESHQLASMTINSSLVATHLVSESRVEDGAYAGGTSGTRDIGVMAFDAVPVGPIVASYALMLSNGQPGVVDATTAKDLSGRIMVSRVLSGERNDPHRREVSAFAWRQQGEREQDGAIGPRIRQGAGVHVETAPVRARVEAVYARGHVELGPDPPFPGQPIEVAVDGEAWGGYALARGTWRELSLGARAERLWRGSGEPGSLRVASTLTVDAELAFSPRARINLDYELRDLAAPDGDADDRTIADTLGDRLSAQVTVVF